MSDPKNPLSCQYKVGFLSLKRCELPGAAQCFMCNKQVCETHSRALEGTKVCLECFAEKSKATPVNEADEEAMTRGRIYRSHGYRSHYYDDDYYYYNRPRTIVTSQGQDDAKGKDATNPDDFQGS